MKFTRLTLVLLIVLVVALAGGGWLWATGTKIPAPWIKVDVNAPVTTAITNTAANVNTKTTPTTNISLPTEVKGDTVFSGTLAVGTTTLKFSSLSRAHSFVDLVAGDGKTILVLYIDQVTPAEAQTLGRSFGRQTVLEYQGGTAQLKRYKIASGGIRNDRGYLVFEVPTNATKIFLVYGTGIQAPRLSIPAAI